MMLTLNVHSTMLGDFVVAARRTTAWLLDHPIAFTALTTTTWHFSFSFAAAGVLLVFFISALNLTVTQGMVNGLIFYANIVWTNYQSILFPQVESEPVLVFLKTFIAWFNLDFGIQVCFVKD